jgi:heme exporter protein D
MPKFNFASFADFLAMGNYALYVWLSFGLTFVVLFGLWLISNRQQQQFHQQLRVRIAREARVRQHQSQQPSQVQEP